MDPAQSQMVLDNLPLVGYVLGRMVRLETAVLDREDLYQEGVIGLMEAVTRWDPESAKLSTYAYRIIRGRIIDAMRRTHRERSRNGARDTQISYLPDGWDVPDNPQDVECVDRRVLVEQLAEAAGLTVREEQVIRGLLTGKTQADLARQAEVTGATISLRYGSAVKKMRDVA
ncbi:hypothetical protein LCGC14_1732920 [marine sediment metagenome]|uniref:RNA polymerase sigma factor SigS n=1 Tax=marine sediment metagenome TaxID=412755 RepID=A0A0F9HWN7_9ZZZZ